MMLFYSLVVLLSHCCDYQMKLKEDLSLLVYQLDGK